MTDHTPHKGNVDWESAIEGSVKMLCNFYFHKEMASTAQSAETNHAMFVDEFQRLFGKIDFFIAQAVADARDEKQDKINLIQLAAFKKGKEACKTELQEKIEKFADRNDDGMWYGREITDHILTLLEEEKPECLTCTWAAEKPDRRGCKVHKTGIGGDGV